MVPRRLSRVVPLVLALAVLAGGACRQSVEPLGAADEATRGAPWTPEGRREALRAPRPGQAIDVPVPDGATRAILHVTAATDRRWSWRGIATATVSRMR